MFGSCEHDPGAEEDDFIMFPNGDAIPPLQGLPIVPACP